jgi:hypothetical protein
MGATKKQDGKVKPRPEGQLRQSQLVTTFGPGSMVDLINRAVVIGGLEHWGFGPKRDQFVPLDDARLRRLLVPRLKALDPDLELAKVNYFRMPPAGDSRDPFPNVGIKALEFPRWFVCQNCHRLARAADAFENKGGRYRHECKPNKRSHAVPVRFVSACQRGHLSDFPWLLFCHAEREDGVCDRPELYLHEGATGDFGRIRVSCENCHSSQTMNRAMALAYKCTGDRPWLGRAAGEPDCGLDAKLLVRTASDAYFAQVVSALRLPEPAPDPLRNAVRQKEVWKAVHKVTSTEQLVMLAPLQEVVEGLLNGNDAAKVLAAIVAERDANEAQQEQPLKSVEYARIVSAPVELVGVTPDPDVEFAAYRIPDQRADLPSGVKRLIIVPELREVRVQISFSRFSSISANLQGEYEFDKQKVKPAVLTLPTGNEKWLPAAEVRGEGVFVELDDALLSAWEQRSVVQERAEQLLRGFESEDRGTAFPGIRFYLLHSLSHLLLTSISLECGYAASAIRERIYCGSDDRGGPMMSAILLSTGTTGSEGTLGGLVEEGRRIRHHLREAWTLGRLCSNDPVCAAHGPAAEAGARGAEGAACHGCLYVAECSCEHFNRYLDRALVVPTIGNSPELAFFSDQP